MLYLFFLYDDDCGWCSFFARCLVNWEWGILLGCEYFSRFFFFDRFNAFLYVQVILLCPTLTFYNVDWP